MRSLGMIVIFALASSAMALAAQSPQSPRIHAAFPAVHSTTVAPEVRHRPIPLGIAYRATLKLCRVPAYFGAGTKRIMDVVYYSAGDTCGLPPFYGFAFGSPSKP